MPVLAGIGAFFAWGATSIGAGMVVGAVVGAVVGGIAAAVTGGDIGKGVLFGAIGGAILGGVSSAIGAMGSTAGSTTINAGNVAAESAATDAAFATAAPAAAEAGMTAGEGTMYAAGVTTAGQAVAGYAQGEQAAKANEAALAAQKEAAQTQFEQSMIKMQEEHKLRMEEASGAGNPGAEIARINADSAMNQLNTRIGADKEATAASIADREAEQTALNNSIKGTDKALFDRPTFNFSPGAETEEKAFDSGFNEAVAAKPLTPEEQAIIDQQKATV